MLPGDSIGSEALAMYRDLVSRNLKSALRASRRGAPALTVFCLVLAGLFGVNAFGLLVRGRGIVFLFPTAELCGILSAAAAAACVIAGTGVLLSAVRKTGKNAFARRWERYLAQIREVGSEDEVFARLDALEPAADASPDLRFDEAVIAGTSPEDPDRNFVYPTAALIRAGVGRVGSVPFLYLHFNDHGKAVKQTANFSPEDCEDTVRRLKEYIPDRSPVDAPSPEPEEETTEELTE